MSDVVVGVRLNGDGSGLVGQLRVSSSEFDRLRAAEKGVADGARDVSAATGQAASGLANTSVEARKAAFNLSHLSEQSEAQTRAQKQAGEAAKSLNGNIGLQRAGWQSLGYQMQDIGIQYSMNTRLSQIMAMQSGQVFSAINMIAQGSENAQGKLGKFAAIMGGPWGIAATVAISLGSALWSQLSKVDDASDDASQSTINFSSSLVAQQSIVANSTDGIKQLEEATRGLINTQAILLDNLQLVSKASVGELERQLAGVDAQIDKLSKFKPPINLIPFLDDPASSRIADLQQQRNDVLGQLASARRSLASARVGLEERAANERADPDERARGEIERERARLRERRQYTLGLETGSVPLADGPSLDQLSAAQFDQQMAELKRRENALKDRAKPKKDNSAAKAAREAERLAVFGERAEDAIARMNDQFNAAPRDIDQARQATAKLDDIIADLEKRKPKNFEALIAQAEAVKPLIQESLVRPIRQMLADQERQIDLGELQLAGRQADADALQLTYQLMDKLGVESEQQLATELAKRGVTEDQVRALYDNLDVMREQTREMRVQQQLQQMFLSAVGDMRENVRLTFESLRTDGPKALEDFGKRFVDVFDRLFSETITEKLFGDFFRDLEDDITGGDKLSKAGDKMAEAVGRAAREIDRTSSDITDLGKAAATAAANISGAKASVPAGWVVGDDGKPFDPNAPADIIVNGNKPDILKDLKLGFKEGYGDFFDELKGDFRNIFTEIFGDKGIFSESLGKTLGGLTAGAQTGSLAGNLVTDVLGIKGSSTGGAIGGAIGSAIAGPLGSIVGGTLGSVVGGLFKKTKYGTSVVTGGDSEDVSTAGNSSSREKASIGLASSIQDTLGQVAEEFGAKIGSFNTSIGVYKDKYRVSTTGYEGKLNFSGASANGLYNFDDDQAGAIAFATLDAIRDGGLEGLSDAVRKAFSSSDDLDEALEEALKVREVEKLLGGLGAELEDQFKAFETQAKERVRIATQYGFDVVEIEKRNAEDRAKLVDEILSDRVGSLQQLLNDMKFGDLFEGSAADRREALLVEIAKARQAAEAGEDGAADTLADLLRQLTELSREAYGTAGDEYAADRDNAVSAAEAVIKAENDRIKAAQDAVDATNAKLDTANELANEQVQYLAEIASSLARAGVVVSTVVPELNQALVAR
jgi:hypothetical protein